MADMESIDLCFEKDAELRTCAACGKGVLSAKSVTNTNETI